MAATTPIEWSDATCNPINGCREVSGGCKHCWAATLAATRLKHLPSRKGLAVGRPAPGGYRWTGATRFDERALAQPLRWRRPRRIFMCSASDLFYEEVPREWIDRVFAVMALAPLHTFQILTKRPQRMRDYLRDGLTRSRIHELIYGWLLHGWPAPGGYRFSGLRCRECQIRADRWQPEFRWPLPNAWLGVSCEDQLTADKRIHVLLDTPAAVRWVSVEPLLGPVDLRDLTLPLLGRTGTFDALTKELDTRLDWVVAGGESGRMARPMEPDWARQIMHQCVDTNTPFFFKQWGGPNKKAAGRLLDGREWSQFPQGVA